MSAVARRQVAKTKSLPSPVGGWNARDPLALMDESDAVILENWFPRAGDVVQRNGYTVHSTGLPSSVETLMAYNGPVTQKLFGISNGGIYDITSSGAVGAAAVSSLSNSKWQYVNFSTAGGNYMYLVNGTDSPRLYDGSTFTAITGVSTPAITGVTTTGLIHVNSFKRRLWFVEKDTLNIWYLPVDSVGGAASKLSFASIARNGGYLMAMATWTIDAGEGADDYAVFITSEGEYIVYKGTDPDDPGAWGLIGVWKLGVPIGRRCFKKVGGDVLIITKDGLIPLSKALISDRVDPRIALTDKIQQAMSVAAVQYGANFGWEVCFFPPANMILLNVPVGSNSQEQYVMNNITGSWCKFTDWLANCFEVFQDELYFGGSTVVLQAWNGLNDNGNDITTDALQAFNYFGDRARTKHWKMMRPILSVSGTPEIQIGINTDFSRIADFSTPSFSPNNIFTWDVDEWDSDFVWGGANSIVLTDWQTISGIGYNAAPRLSSVSQGIEVAWVATDFVYEYGAVI